MPLTQLVYTSRRTRMLDESTLRAIVSTSAAANRRRQITGVLMCCGSHIMQLLEGDESDLNPLLGRLKDDTRHENIQLMLRKSVDRRLFPEWGMGLADLKSKILIDRGRLARIVQDVQNQNDTRRLSVEARLLIHDFQQ